MKNRSFIILALGMVALIVYLFATAPAPLPEDNGDVAGVMVPIEMVLETVASENDRARTLYTKEVVGKGKAVGLKFDEQWREESIEAGPLPALYLRESAANIQRSEIPLGLFLGSDFPISSSNKFEGEQSAIFERIKKDRKAVTFFAEDIGMYTSMVPDIASVDACVTCHNEHEQSPKTDWEIGDVMGATTWTYPKGEVSVKEYLAIIVAVRQGLRDSYSAYLEKTRSFEDPPEIGERWPREGRYLPSADVFMAEFERSASPETAQRLLSLSSKYR